MKTLIQFLLLYFISVIGAEAQNFNGTVHYQSQREFQMKMDSSIMNSEMQKSIRAQIRSQLDKVYELNFNKEVSIYKELENLESPMPGSRNIQITSSAERDILYKDIDKKQWIKQRDLMGKLFLITQNTEKPSWKLMKESKKIGEYTCFKAVWTRDEKYTELDNGSFVEKTKEKTTTAWYTPQIPVQHGPDEYWGLPGLILEVQEERMSLLCTRIVLNPEKPVRIDEPDRGKEVTEEEFENIRKKKNKELLERYNTKNTDGSKTIIIKSN